MLADDADVVVGSGMSTDKVETAVTDELVAGDVTLDVAFTVVDGMLLALGVDVDDDVVDGSMDAD